MLMRDYVSEEGGWPYGDIRNYVFLHICFCIFIFYIYGIFDRIDLMYRHYQ